MEVCDYGYNNSESNDSDCYVRECEIENIQLREALQDKDSQIIMLKNKLENSRQIIQQMETEMMKLTEESSNASSDEEPRKKKTISKEVIQRWDFYNTHKNDVTIIKTLEEQCRSIGITKVPWQLVKVKTDELFFAKASK